MAIDLFSLSFFEPLLPSINIIADELLLLCVNGNDRLGGAHLRRYAGIDVFELSIPVGMLFPFDRLIVSLKTVAHPTEKSAYQATAGRISQTLQLTRKTVRTLAGPAQRRHRVADRQRLHKIFQLGRQIGLMVDGRLPSAAGSANLSVRKNLAGQNLTQSDENRASGNLRGARHQRNTAVSKRASFGGAPNPPRVFIQPRCQRFIFLPNCGLDRCHTKSIRCSQANMIQLFCRCSLGSERGKLHGRRVN